MNQQIVLFCKKLAALLLILVATDFLAGQLLQRLYLNQRSGSAFKTVYAVEKCREPLVIMGSSRAYHHYNTSLIEKKTGLKGYNLGRDGSGILYDYAVFNTICERAVPKCLVLDINLEEFQQQQITYDLLYQLLPHYKKNAYIREVVNLRSPFEFLKAQSSLYRHNSQLFYTLVYNFGSQKEEKGFLPLHGKIDSSIHYPPQTEGATDSLLVHYFERLIQTAQRKGTRMYACVSPTLNEYLQSKSLAITRLLCDQYNIRFYDFSTDTAFTCHRELFSDYSHMNAEGAQLFSERIADSILADAAARRP